MCDAFERKGYDFWKSKKNMNLRVDTAVKESNTPVKF